MASKDYVAIANKYVDDVLGGEIPSCKWVKLACKRQGDDLKRWSNTEDKFYFVPEVANRVCSFIENLPHIKGEWANKKMLITLEPWQIFNITTIFGWYKTENWSRRFREAYLEIPRKNSKSTMAATLGLYMFVGDDESGAEVYSGATSEAQAKEVFIPAKLMAQRAEGFADHYGVEINASNMACLDNASKFQPIIGNPGDGSSPHCSIIDEFHEHKTASLYDTMVTGMGARLQPLNLIITTAGVDISSPCYDKRDQICNILGGTIEHENNETFGIIYTIDKDDDWTDFEVWKKANPNIGVSVYEDFLRSRLKQAIQRTSKQNIIRCKHLNQWMNAGSAFFNMFDWDKCEDKSLNLEDFRGEKCWVGIDLASKVDVAVLCLLFERDDNYYVFLKHYLPEDAIDGKDKDHYKGWAEDGWITLTMGNMTDIDIIEEDLLEFGRLYEIQEVDHDPWNATQFIQRLQKNKIECVEIPQTVPFMSEPMKHLEAIMGANTIHHNGDPVLTWMIANTCGRYDKNDNVFPYKERPESKIDGTIGILNALGRAMRVQKSKSKYNKKGLTVI